MKRLAINHLIIAALCISAVFTACSSPESDGIKAAKRMHSYRKDVSKKMLEIINEQNKAYEAYIKDFDSYSFRTRFDAQEKLNEYLEKSVAKFNELEENAREWENKANNYRDELRSKYDTNKDNKEKFDYAYDNYKYDDSEEDPSKGATFVNNSKKIQALIQSIVPPADQGYLGKYVATGNKSGINYSKSYIELLDGGKAKISQNMCEGWEVFETEFTISDNILKISPFNIVFKIRNDIITLPPIDEWGQFQECSYATIYRKVK